MDKITIELYTPTSIAVFGNTISIKEHFKRIGGMYNANLKGTDGDTKRKGWIFPKAKLQDVRGLLEDYRNDRVDTSYIHPSKSGASQLQSQTTSRPVSAYAASSKQRDDDSVEPEFIVTHKMYLSMISRLERLEAELTIAKKALAGTIQSSERPKAVKSKPPSPVQVVFEDDDEQPEEEEEEEIVAPPQKEVKIVPEFEDIPEFQPKRLLGRKKQQPEINL